MKEIEVIKEELLQDINWEETYNKLINKAYISKEDKEEITKLNMLYKEQIVEQLISGEYEWSIPEKIEIAKQGSKKKRIVYKYNTTDRYILGVLYRAISRVYNNQFSNLCFSYKKGQSTSSAIWAIKENKLSNEIGVKVDIHSYFNSVSRERVTELINEWFPGGLNKSIKKLMLDDKVYFHGQLINEWKSLVPGCALGSFFANACLKEVDEHFENLNITYARYSDDIILFDKTEEDVQRHLDYIIKSIGEYGLTMNPDKYTFFKENEAVEYLGLRIREDGKIDIANHAKQKIKKQVHRWCRKERVEIEKGNTTFEKAARGILRRFNYKNMICSLTGDNTFGWCGYSFKYITTTDSLKEIDLYVKDCIRALKTGKHNKANYKAVSEEEFNSLGFTSLVTMYHTYKYDKDYYYELIDLLSIRH